MIRSEQSDVAAELKLSSTRAKLQSAIKMTTGKSFQRKQRFTWARTVQTVPTALNIFVEAARPLLTTLVKLVSSTVCTKKHWSAGFVAESWKRGTKIRVLPSLMFAQTMIAKGWCSKAATKFLCATTLAKVYAMKILACHVWTRTAWLGTRNLCKISMVTLTARFATLRLCRTSLAFS